MISAVAEGVIVNLHPAFPAADGALLNESYSALDVTDIVAVVSVP